MAESSSNKRKLPDDFDLLDKPKQQEKRVRFPKGKKFKQGDQVPVAHQPAEDVKPETEAQIAAKERALRRNKILTAEEDTELLHDISAAEVRYKDNDTFVDDGVNIEPFNLEKENKEGFFDDAGNYVEYINKNVIRDAWLDNVDNVDIDPKLADKRVVIADENESLELSSKDIGMIKRRMADVLLPGETVLQALRRLKGTSTGKKEKMSAETKIIFDQLTEDAMRLMENDVYEENKEVFQREAEGYEKLANLRGEGTSAISGQVDDSFDMFAEDEDKANANPASGESYLVSGHNSNGNSQPSESGSLQTDYIYDESSGYYYSSSSGYYYDPSSGLYCSASGQWYSYNEETSAWEEVQGAESTLNP